MGRSSLCGLVRGRLLLGCSCLDVGFVEVVRHCRLFVGVGIWCGWCGEDDRLALLLGGCGG